MKFSKFLRTSFLRLHGNIKSFERSAVLWGGRDHTWRDLFSWFHRIRKTEILA